MSVLQRKARAGKEERQARSMTVPKSLRVALAKVGDDLFDLALAVIGATQEVCGGDQLAARFEDGPLMLLLDGPAGATGGAIVEAGLVHALVQQQTMGKVFAPQDTARAMTSTDAALCAPLFDQLFPKAHGLLESDEDKRLLGPYRFGAKCENARLFSLALDASDYHILKLTVDVAGGIAQATLTLILPEPTVLPAAATPSSEAPSQGTMLPMAKTVMGLPTELTAVLCQFKMPIAQIGKLEPGMTFPVHAEAFDDVKLYSNDGRRVAKGALGQVDGQRALMLDAGDGQQAKMSGAAAAKSATATLDQTEERSSDDFAGITLDGEASPVPDEGAFDLPDLPDLPELDIDGDMNTDIGGLPDLSDIPDLPDLDDDLPDLDDFPKMNIA